MASLPSAPAAPAAPSVGDPASTAATSAVTSAVTSTAAPADGHGPGAWAGVALTVAARALVNPALAVDLVRVAWRFRRRHWWRRAPFLPVPDRTYVRWRMHTAYGDPDAVPPAAELIRYARWVGRQR